MKIKYALCALLVFCKSAFGQEALGEYKWQDLKTIPANATLAQVDGRQVLKIENTNDAPLQVNLLTIEHPKITAILYELTGEVRYDSVKGDGYLEMWNIFPAGKDGSPGGEYFSRTLGDSGPMGKISGTSDWREFTLPFDRTGSSGPPTRLKVNLVLPGRGTVYIGPMKLMQMPKTESAAAAPAMKALREYKWKELKTISTNAELVELDGRQVLKIENANDEPLQVNLLRIEHPKIKAMVYELTGEVRYNSVKGDGYLEMWSYFPSVKNGLPAGEYFSRTLGDSGPMGKISGTSDWREFVLPFDRTGASGPPTHLQFNLVLRGRGTVYIGAVKLLEMPKANPASAMVYPGAWWNRPNAGKVLGLCGAAVGCFVGLCGALLGWLGALFGCLAAKGRRFRQRLHPHLGLTEGTGNCL